MHRVAREIYITAACPPHMQPRQPVQERLPERAEYYALVARQNMCDTQAREIYWELYRRAKREQGL